MVNVLDSFEDGNINDWSGDTDIFSVETDSSIAFDGSNYLKGAHPGGGQSEKNAIFKDNESLSPGGALPVSVWAENVDGNQAVTTLVFGVSSVVAGENLEGYIAGYNANAGAFELIRLGDTSQTELAVSLRDNFGSDGFTIDLTKWDTNGNIEVTFEELASGNTHTLAATDTTYTGSNLGVYVGAFTSDFASDHRWDYLTQAEDLSPPDPPSNLTAEVQ